ncbi:MAG: hypothetical protein WCD76_06320 [Pyrinomonadaceae bacterium]
MTKAISFDETASIILKFCFPSILKGVRLKTIVTSVSASRAAPESLSSG